MKYDEKYLDNTPMQPGNQITVNEPDHIHELVLNNDMRECEVCRCLTGWTDNASYICSEECTALHCRIMPGHRY